MKKRRLIILIIFFLAGFSSYAYDLGVIGGGLSKSNQIFIGFSGSMRLIVPGLKIEFEMLKVIDSEDNMMSGGIKFNPKLGKFSVYGILGVGTSFEKINFDFSHYEAFTFLGFGAHLYLMDMLSLRGDMRFYNFTDSIRNRISFGIFLHL